MTQRNPASGGNPPRQVRYCIRIDYVRDKSFPAVAIWFHKGVLKHVAAGRDIVASDKATAVFLVILWMMIMYCGRFIAYAPV